VFTCSDTIKINIEYSSLVIRNYLDKICVSLAASSSDELSILLKRSIEEGADYVEIRFDFLRPAEIQKVLKRVITKDICRRAVFTLRPHSEGGYFSDDLAERTKFLQKLALFKPMLLDVELSLLQENNLLLNFIIKNKVPIMVSWHNYLTTPSRSELLAKVREMRNYSSTIKIVTVANKVEDAISVISLYDSIENTTLIAFAMGESGVLSRLLCTLYGNAPFTYASLNRRTAPGQLTMKTMRKLFIGISNKSKRFYEARI
jgi:3-dehydroquinate dehydratase I